MAAAGLATVAGHRSEITLIESAEIGTVGVGEATLPHVKDFNAYLGIDEAEFMRATQATFKLGIEFVDWGKPGNSYIHPFGAYGQPLGGVDFIHHWTRARLRGQAAPLESYSYAITAARAARFDFPTDDQKSLKSTYAYAYHFDAGLYAAFLRTFAERKGIKRLEGKVVDVRQNPTTGDIAELILQSGEVVTGDLFIDCSGFRALLIEGALHAGWEDWTPWLPCDRALAVPCDRVGEALPYTRATALEAGWQWRIPLQHRTGNGYVFSSAFIDEATAGARLMGNLDGKAQAEPKLLKFAAGRRKTSWANNCVAIGLASGFLEPLESTSIYLAQIAITNLLQLFPDKTIDPRLRAAFNRLVDLEYDRVRDFLILHYHANTRDGEMWAYTRNMTVPDTLNARLEQYRHRGHIQKYKDGLFSPASWLAVYAGQDVLPEGYDRTADAIPATELKTWLDDLEGRIRMNVDEMPGHDAFIRGYCAAPTLAGVA
jgi:tryptophan halogenase